MIEIAGGIILAVLFFFGLALFISALASSRGFRIFVGVCLAAPVVFLIALLLWEAFKTTDIYKLSNGIDIDVKAISRVEAETRQCLRDLPSWQKGEDYAVSRCDLPAERFCITGRRRNPQFCAQYSSDRF